jgi:hypothetical protein
MTPLRFVALCTVVVAVAACDDKGVLGEIRLPYAGIQFVNAVSDTGEMDFRVVDIPENAGLFDAPFRALTAFHTNILAGNRNIRVFVSSTNPAVASDVVWDTTYTFQQGVNYSFALQAYARTGQTPALRALILTDDDPSAIPAGQFAVRVWNLAPTLDPAPTTPVDAWVVPRGPGALAGTPTIANVSYGDRSAYVNVPTGSYRIAFTPTGATSPVLFQAIVPPGEAPDIAGSAVAGSGITVVVAPRSVPSSRAPFSYVAIQGISLLTSTPDSVATAVTAAPHNLTTGDAVIVNGADTAIYNGTFPVTVVNPTTFTYRLSRETTGSPATGYPFWLPSSAGSSFNGRAVSGLTAVGTTATVVTLGNHGFATNDIVTITGANEAAYNGSFVATVVDATTFTYTTDAIPSSPATGTPIFRAGSADFANPNLVFRYDKRP